MYNVQAVVLKMLLASDQKQVALETFSRLRKDHFNDAFTAIYQAVQNYYKKHNGMPSLDALILESNRNARLSQALTVLANTQIPDVDISHAIHVLESEYTQDLFLNLLETDVLQDITILDQGELLDRVAALHMKLEERVTTTGKVFNADTMRVFKRKEDSMLNLISLGISNEFDAQLGGIARKETLLLGGWRGTGKSIICSNIQVAQYYNGDIAPYFSIEMPENEVFRRNLAIMAGVSAKAMRNDSLQGIELNKLAKTRAKMFEGGLEVYNDFVSRYTLNEMSDFHDMETMLMQERPLHTPMIIVYDPELSTATIDVELTKLTSKYGDKVTIALLDYINQVRLPDTKTLDMYDWKQQMVVSSTFKSTCQKHNVAGVAPYQIDQQGNARMARGILDSCDMAANLNAAKQNEGHDGAIKFDFVKTRNSEGMTFMPKINWNSLRMDQTSDLKLEDIRQMEAEFVIPLESDKPKDKPKRKKASDEDTNPTGESSRDL
nr:DnaB-like replicative helicase [Klebsiella phage vB_Kpn_K7PH164C4]